MADGYDPEPVPMQGEYGYYNLLADLWRAGETFVVIEHDIVVYPGAIGAMLDCDHGWCGTVYPYRAAEIACLGCTKFSAEFIAAHPGVPAWVAAREHGWRYLDTQWAAALLPERIHEHRPAVGHERWEA